MLRRWRKQPEQLMKVDMQFMELSNMTYTSVAEFLRIFFLQGLRWSSQVVWGHSQQYLTHWATSCSMLTLMWYWSGRAHLGTIRTTPVELRSFQGCIYDACKVTWYWSSTQVGDMYPNPWPHRNFSLNNKSGLQVIFPQRWFWMKQLVTISLLQLSNYELTAIHLTVSYLF